MSCYCLKNNERVYLKNMEFLVNAEKTSRLGVCAIQACAVNSICGAVACGVNVSPCAVNGCSVNI